MIIDDLCKMADAALDASTFNKPFIVVSNWNSKREPQPIVARREFPGKTVCVVYDGRVHKFWEVYHA